MPPPPLAERSPLVQRYRALAADPVAVRLLAATLFFVGAFFFVLRPQGERLLAAQRDLREATSAKAAAQALLTLTSQRQLYEDRIAGSEDLADWHGYVLGILEQAGAELVQITPRPSTGYGSFRLVNFEIRARGGYQELTDFVDRLERGPRLIRLEKMRLETSSPGLSLQLEVKGLVRSQKP